ncbi:hypothetical protein BV911_18455 [Pseudoruegeria sp. SK021]|nr:hypothetical protein BV911_18455 [Pseudoruegeria sp. SK021]
MGTDLKGRASYLSYYLRKNIGLSGRIYENAAEILTTLGVGISGLYLANEQIYSASVIFDMEDFQSASSFEFELLDATAPVPLPASLPLLVGALGLMGLSRRWRSLPLARLRS